MSLKSNQLEIWDQYDKVYSSTARHVYQNISHQLFYYLSYDVAYGSALIQCNKIYKPLVVYRF